MKKILSVSIILMSLVFATPANAIEAPNFPTCSNPSGDLIVQYDDGIHGIVGRSREYRGEDRVYRLNDTQVLQCLCTDEGEGVQTNWWKVSSLAQAEIDQLRRLGWHFVADGKAWGLERSTYLAKNSDYQCGSNGGSGNGDGGSNETGNQGEILSLAASDEKSLGGVLGYAATGGNAKIYGLLSLGIAMFTSGFALRRKYSNS